MALKFARDSRKAWIVIGLTSFWTYGVLEGSLHSFAVFYAALENQFSAHVCRDHAASTKSGGKCVSKSGTATGSSSVVESDLIAFRVALIGSAMLTVGSLASIVAGILTDIFKAHFLLIIGLLSACSGVLLSALARSIEVWYVTYSLIYGIGNAFCWVAYVAILGDYFDKHYALAYSLTNLGASMSIVYTVVYQRLIDDYSIEAALYFVAANYASLIVCVLIWPTRHELRHCVIRVSTAQKHVDAVERDLSQSDTNETEHPAPERSPNSSRRESLTSKRGPGNERKGPCCGIWSSVRWQLFRQRNFVVFTIAQTLVLIGSSIPDIHIVKFAQTALERRCAPRCDRHSMITLAPLMVYAASSALSKLVFGFWIAKCRTNKRIATWLYQLSSVINGIAMTVIPFFAFDLENVGLMLACCAVWGFADGPGYSLYAPVLRILVGARDTAQAVTYSYAVAQTIALVGAPLGGLLFEAYGTYKFAFLLSGTLILLGSCIMSGMRFGVADPMSDSDSATVEPSAKVLSDLDPDADCEPLDADTATELSSAATLKPSDGLRIHSASSVL